MWFCYYYIEEVDKNFFRFVRKGALHMDEKFIHDTGVELIKLAKLTISNYKKFSKTAVAEDDISVCGLEILTSLRYFPDKNTVSEIAEQVEVSKGLVSREVEALRQKGFITTDVDSNDRRILRIFIAPGAEELIRKQKVMLFNLIYQMAGDLTQDQLEKFRELIHMVMENASNVDITKHIDIDVDLDHYQTF
jgi:DNA-binding MarR family transcriptional regulator